jgi:hypothetical protein
MLELDIRQEILCPKEMDRTLEQLRKEGDE